MTLIREFVIGVSSFACQSAMVRSTNGIVGLFEFEKFMSSSAIDSQKLRLEDEIRAGGGRLRRSAATGAIDSLDARARLQITRIDPSRQNAKLTNPSHVFIAPSTFIKATQGTEGGCHTVAIIINPTILIAVVRLCGM